MDRRQRRADPVEQFRSGFEGMQSQLWTALPARIDSVQLNTGGGDYPLTARVTCQVQIEVTAQDGSAKWVTIPQLVDCPIVFPGGGGFTLTFPLAAGDEVLVVFASRCIDNWLVQQGQAGQGGARPQAELRMHDLSDGFVIPGIRNTTRALSSISTTDVQLRSDDGQLKLGINQAAPDIYAHNNVGDITLQASGDITETSGATINLGGHVVNIAATAGTLTISSSSNIVIDAPSTTVTGALIVDGNLVISGLTFFDGTRFDLHEHSGVTTGGGNTGPVV